MSRECIWLFLALFLISYSLADKSEYGPSETWNKHSPPEERLLANIVRGRNSSKALNVSENDSEVDDKAVVTTAAADKRARTATPGYASDTKDNCCQVGARYNSKGSTRPDSHYSRIPQDGRPSSSQYTPVDRHGWQTQTRPSGSNGNTARPGSGSFGAASGNGNTLYSGSHSGDRFNTRPSIGTDHYGRPGNYGSGGYGYGSGSYGGFGRPTSQGSGVGNYGISGTLADGEEFGPGDPGYPDANPPPHSNIQTQKAIALKALAGVALIGAAAALATNPVLLPIGILAGRRKRSNIDAQTDFILQLLRNHYPKVHIRGIAGGKIIMSPRCAARLTCEIQRNYLSDLDKDVEILGDEDLNPRQHLSNLIRSNVLNADSLNDSVKKLIQTGMSLGSTGGDCTVFTCSFVRAG